MPISKIKLNGFQTDSLFLNTEISGTEAARMPVGTTAQRANAQVGDLRHNTTIGILEQYTSTGWQGIASPPVVTSISPTDINESDSTQTIVITGSNFDTGAVGTLKNSSAATVTPTTSTRNTISQITIVFSGGDAITTDAGPYDVVVTNGSGLSANLADALTLDNTPAWSTSAGSLGTVIEDVAMSTTTVAASDPEGGSVTYSVTSGALPTGTSLGSSNGQITGTPNVSDSYNASGVTHNFTVTANDGTGNTTPRAFSILRKWGDGSSAATAATSATSIKTITGTSTSGLYYLQTASMAYPAQIYCEMSLHGGGWIYLLQKNHTGHGVGFQNSWLSAQSGTQNHATADFYGTTDTNGTALSPFDIWDKFVGSSTAAKVYFREIQHVGGTYDESQRYTNSSDGALITKTEYQRLYAGNFSDGVGGIKVWFNNGSSSVTGKEIEEWSGNNLVTINNGVVDGELYYCNGNGVDTNWSFGLMKGGTPYPKAANTTNGGNRTGTMQRWGIAAIKA